MDEREISFASAEALCAVREVDLVLAVSPPPFVLCFRGQFDGYGEFFSILAADVEYVDTAGGFTLGGMLMFSNVEKALVASPKWEDLAGVVSGSALVMRSAESESWKDARPRDLFLLVANRIVFLAGADWERAGGIGP